MRRYRIEAVWDITTDEPVVDLRFHRIDPVGPELDEAVRVELGTLRITEPRQMTEKRVRASALAWLATQGMAPSDSYEMTIITTTDREGLTRIEAALAR